jgi:hypothetical protein
VVARRRAALEIANGFLFPGQQVEDGDVFLVEGSLALSQRRARGRQLLDRAVLYRCSRADEATIRDALSDDEEQTKSQKKATTEHHWCV